MTYLTRFHPLNYYEREALIRHISRVVCGPYKCDTNKGLRLHPATLDIHWTVVVRYSEVKQLKSGVITMRELAKLTKQLKNSYYLGED